MSRVCVNCGRKLPESGICDCQQAEQYNQAVTTGTNTESPFQPPTQTQANTRVNDAMQKTTALLGGALQFFKLFILQPVTTMQLHSIRMSETLFFVALQPVTLFIMFLAIAGRVTAGFSSIFSLFGGYGLGSYILQDSIGLFFKTFFFCIGTLFTLMVISIILGTYLYKGTLDIKKHFALMVIAHIPLTVSFILATIFIFFSAQFAILALIFGIIASIIIGTFIFAASFNISFDKCVYCSILTYLVQTIVINILVQNMLGF